MGWNDIFLNNFFYKCTTQAEYHYGTIYTLARSVRWFHALTGHWVGWQQLYAPKENAAVIQEQKY